jgi:DUF4097 and DUF4098 domain-containing protein YvlB
MASGSTPVSPTPPVQAVGAPPPYRGRPGRYRPRSIFSGLLLILVGALLLISRLAPNVDLGYWFAHYWPVIIILWGVAKLIDRMAFTAPASEARFDPNTGAPLKVATRPPLLTGGEFGLIVFLMLILGLVFVHGWLRQVLPRGVMDSSPFARTAAQTQHASATAIAPNSKIVIKGTDGDVTVHPSATSDLLVSASESARGDTDSEANAALARVQVAIDHTSDGYVVHPVNDKNGDISVDLDVTVPKSAGVSAATQHGDIRITDAVGNVETSAGAGDVTIRNTTGAVSADSGPGDTKIDGASATVRFHKRGPGDVEISNVQGEAQIEGNTLGDVVIRNVTKGVSLSSTRTTFSAAALPGELRLDRGDIHLSHAAGPVSITAHNQDVTANNVDGQFDVTAQHGDVEIEYSQPPKAPISITTDSGDVSLSLPAGASFSVSAVSKSGDLENDFGGSSDDHAGSHSLNATYGSGGPQIRITSHYGDIHIHKN